MRLNKESLKLCKQLFRSSFTNDKLGGVKVTAITRTVAAEKPRL